MPAEENTNPETTESGRQAAEGASEATKTATEHFQELLDLIMAGNS